MGTNIQFSLCQITVANGLSTNGAGLLNAGGTVNITNGAFEGNAVLGSLSSAPTGGVTAGAERSPTSARWDW